MIDFETLELNWKPNQFLMAPEGLCRNATPHAISPTFDIGPADLMDRVRAMALSQPRVTETSDGGSGLQAVFVARSRVFRFPDVIDVAVLPVGETGSAVAFYSRAKIGVRDFGVNRSRIEDWVARLQS